MINYGISHSSNGCARNRMFDSSASTTYEPMMKGDEMMSEYIRYGTGECGTSCYIYILY